MKSRKIKIKKSDDRFEVVNSSYRLMQNANGTYTRIHKYSVVRFNMIVNRYY